MTDLGFIHRFEPSAGGSPRTLLVFHGTGGDETSLIPIARAIAPGWNYLSPRGKVLENGMPRFFRRFAEGVLDEEDIKRQAADLRDFIEAAVKEYDLDLEHIGALGYSNGANIASSLMLLDTKLIRWAVLIRAMVPLIPAAPPDLAGTEVLLSQGEFDPLVSPEETERLRELLQLYDSKVEVLTNNSGHDLTREEIEYARSWLIARV